MVKIEIVCMTGRIRSLRERELARTARRKRATSVVNFMTSLENDKDYEKFLLYLGLFGGFDENEIFL